jgi:hypothetical protein
MKIITSGVFVLVTLSCLFITSCDKQNTNNVLAISPQGNWQSVGYGRTAVIDSEGDFVLSDVTKYSCLSLTEGNLSDFGDNLRITKDTISIRDGINRYLYTRINELPAICSEDLTKNTQDPELNFEVLWNTFNDHYAYFELRKINWDSMYRVYRPRVTSNTSEVELYKIMNEMISAMNDGHVGLEAPDEIMTEVYTETKTEGSSETPVQKYGNHEVAKHIADAYIPEGSSRHKELLRWGVLENNIGYVQLNQMMGLAEYNLSDSLSGRDYWMAYFEQSDTSEDDTSDEVDGIRNSMKSVMNDLAETNAIIIDVRFNGGGKDEVGMEVLRHFNNQKKTVFTKKARYGDGFTPRIEIMQDGTPNFYNNPVYLLISGESASATEIMVLCSLSMDNITRVGSNTEGIFSDVLDKELPNGWEIDLSNELYEDMNGTNYEGIGIAPDIEMNNPRDKQEFLSMIMNSVLSNGDAAIESIIDRYQD